MVSTAFGFSSKILNVLVHIRKIFLRLMCLVACAALSYGQQAAQEQDDEVLRVKTDLVQTDVRVFDKEGRFVEGLQREQFELKIDGKAQPISFFEQVSGERLQANARLAINDKTPLPPSVQRGRTIIFFIDDLHLSPGSLARTREMLMQFIENEMNDADQVLLASASGEIGFLQQFTESKTALRAAVKRLVYKPYNVRDMTRESAPMTEYMALAIERREDPRIMRFYVEECLKYAPIRYQAISCEVETINRARMVLLQAANVTANTYGALEKLMQAAGRLPGRKLAFFVSDGFLLDTGPRNSDPRARLHKITDAALRAGIVLYTIDATGLRSGQLDATNNVPMDANGRLENISLREAAAAQDALNALASDTGGRALRNQNTFGPWVSKILEETASYYLLAWRPESEEQTSGDFKKISVRVVGHPEWTVRLPRAGVRVGAAPEQKPAEKAQPEAKSPQQQLRDALASPSPKREIPTSLSAIYLDTPEHGMVLTASVQLDGGNLTYEAAEGKRVAEVDVVGLLFDDKGKDAGNFQTRLKITAGALDAADNRQTFYNHRFTIKPGLYQVLVAARDSRSGLAGSARQWIEVPDLSSRKLGLSSLIVGLQDAGAHAATGRGDASREQVQFSVDHRFARQTPLRFIAFIYNASRGTGDKASPSILLQAQLLRANQAVLKTPWSKLSATAQDAARIPYGGEIPLGALPAGQYILQVTIKDQLAGTTATQQTKIVIE